MTSIGTLTATLEADATGMKAGTNTAIDALRKTQAESAKTRNVMKHALGADVAVTQAGRIVGALRAIDTQGASTAAKAAEVGISLAAGLAMGGVVGLGLAAVGQGVMLIADRYADMKRAALEALDASFKRLGEVKSEAAKFADDLAKVNAEWRAFQLARNTGVSFAEASRTITLDQARKEIGFQEMLAGGTRAQIEAQRAEEKQLKVWQAQGGMMKSGESKNWEIQQRLADIETNKPALGMLLAEQEAAAEAARSAAAYAEKAFRYEQEKEKAAREDAERDKSTAKARAESERIAASAAAEAARAAKELATLLDMPANAGVEFARAVREAQGRLTTEREYTTAESRGETIARKGRGWLDRFLAGAEDTRRTEALTAGIQADVAAARASRDLADSVALAAIELGEFSGSIADQAQRLAAAARGQTTISGGAVAFSSGEAARGAAASMGGAIGTAAAGDWVGAAVQLLMQSKQVQHVMGLFDGILQTVADAFGSLLEPFIPFISIIAKVVEAVATIIAPLAALAVFEPVLLLLFDAVKFVGGVIAGIAAGIKWIIVAVKNAFYSGVASLLEWISASLFENQIKALRAMIEMQGSFTATVADAFSAINDLDFKALKDEIGKTNAELREELHNLPAGFKIARARWDAQDAEGDRPREMREALTAGGPRGQVRGALLGEGGAAFHTRINNVVFTGVRNASDLAQKWLAMLERQGVVEFGAPGASGSRWLTEGT